MVTPCTLRIIDDALVGGRINPLLHKRSCAPVLDKIVQPAGNPVCRLLAKNVTLAGIVTIGRNFDTAILPVPVLPTTIKRSLVPPTETTPEFEGRTLIDGLACPKA